MASVFFSYSHEDEALRDELEKHLAMMKRNGEIETWHDRRIRAGDPLDSAIDERLEQSDIILLLLSPAFLASDYCYDIEKSRALELQNEGKARVISVILRPCDWRETPLAQFLVTPTDGKAVVKWTNQDDAFQDVVKSIRNALPQPPAHSSPTPSPPVAPALPARSSNLRLKKSFTQAEKDDFAEQTFNYLAEFFQNSLNELETRNTGIQTRFKQIDATHFFAEIYQNGNSVSKAHIRHGGHSLMGGGITYSTSSSPNSINEQLSVEVGEHSLSLKPMGMSAIGFGSVAQGALSQQGAAEFYWKLLLNPLQ